MGGNETIKEILEKYNSEMKQLGVGRTERRFELKMLKSRLEKKK